MTQPGNPYRELDGPSRQEFADLAERVAQLTARKTKATKEPFTIKSWHGLVGCLIVLCINALISGIVYDVMPSSDVKNALFGVMGILSLAAIGVAFGIAVEGDGLMYEWPSRKKSY
jgi:hypothetical protein